MSRIRTIKPEFFRHEELFEAEKSSGLPLRVAFPALWTVADREGRFRWRPKVLKLDCLPFDELDFEDVLNALCEFGFVVKYQVGSETFGHIPKFVEHQVLNIREPASKIPAPAENCTEIVPEQYRASREGKGKGKGREGILSSKTGNGFDVSESKDLVQKATEAWNETAAVIGAAKIRAITKTRETLIRQRAHDLRCFDHGDPIVGFYALFAKIRASPFLRGETNGFRATFDWALKEANFTKIMEGNYEKNSIKTRT